MNVYKFMMIAREQSLNSTYPQKVGACIIKGNRIISKGFNQMRYCSTGIRYTPWENSIHAERDACRKVEKTKLKGSTIFVYRELANGKTALAKPCTGCMELLIDVGIKKVYYSTEDYPYYNIIKL